MRRIAIILLTLLLSVPLFCQEIQMIKNQAKEIGNHFGRQVPLTVAWVLSDDGERFFFKNPKELRTTPNGSLMVMEGQQIYKFDRNGKFERSLVKSGQGPGEVTMISNYFPVGDNQVLIHDMRTNKVVQIDGNGKLISEKRLKSITIPTLFHEDKERFYLTNDEFKSTKGTAFVTDVDKQIVAVSKKDNTRKKLFSFGLKNFVCKTKSSFAIVRLIPFLSSLKENSKFFISHTSEYKIKLVDLETNKVLMEFSRDYERIKVTDKNKKQANQCSFDMEGKHYESPLPEYLNDIQSIHYSNGKLWVFTSTIDPDKGVLVDIFDGKGKYLDCFYLKLRGKESHHQLFQFYVNISGNAIFVLEQDESDNLVINKYLITGKNETK